MSQDVSLSQPSSIAKAIAREFLYACGLEYPGDALFLRWATRYETFLWVSQSEPHAWLSALCETLETGQAIKFEKPDRMASWLAGHAKTKELPMALINHFLGALTACDPGWRSSSIRRSVELTLGERL